MSSHTTSGGSAVTTNRVLASVLLIIGGAMFGFARGRRASRLDG